MTVPEALELATEWTKGQTFYEGMGGGRVVVATLAAEVNRLNAEKEAAAAKSFDEWWNRPRGAYDTKPFPESGAALEDWCREAWEDGYSSRE